MGLHACTAAWHGLCMCPLELHPRQLRRVQVHAGGQRQHGVCVQQVVGRDHERLSWRQWRTPSLAPTAHSRGAMDIIFIQRGQRKMERQRGADAARGENKRHS
jgi:hypothetical protein